MSAALVLLVGGQQLAGPALRPQPDLARLFMGTPGAPNAGRQSACLGLWSCCRATWGGRTMDRRNIYIIIGAVIVLVVIGYATGWFGGSAPPPAAQ